MNQWRSEGMAEECQGRKFYRSAKLDFGNNG